MTLLSRINKFLATVIEIVVYPISMATVPGQSTIEIERSLYKVPSKLVLS